ncbi:hypothetical protein DFP73DRAFT_566386 [Morchella snyderi]|nr:hypothetical protein DFP73DRAFT_566386 [Morchella snyderi]
MPNNIIVVFYSFLLLFIIITASLSGPTAFVPIGRVFRWFQLQFQFETACNWHAGVRKQILILCSNPTTIKMHA